MAAKCEAGIDTRSLLLPEAGAQASQLELSLMLTLERRTDRIHCVRSVAEGQGEEDNVTHFQMRSRDDQRHVCLPGSSSSSCQTLGGSFRIFKM